MVRALRSVFEAYGVPFDLIEVHDIRFQTCWDAPLDRSALVPEYDPAVFMFDYPFAAEAPWRNRWLDEVEDRGAAYAVVRPTPCIADYSGHWDAADLGPGDRVSRAGFYEPFVWWADAEDGLSHGTPFDGEDYALRALYAAAYAALQAVRAGGVFVTLELLGE